MGTVHTSLVSRLTCSETRLLCPWFILHDSFFFLLRKKSNMGAVGCFVHLEGNPCGWESVVLGAGSHAMSSVRAHREEMQ